MTKRTTKEIEQEALEVATLAIKKATEDRDAAIDQIFSTHKATVAAINATFSQAMGWLDE